MPSLAPVSKCSRVPRHYCHKTFLPRLVKKPIIIKWCIEQEEEEEEEQQPDTNPVLDARLLFEDEHHHEETDDQAQMTNSLLDARLLFNDEI